jgi:carbonyl reductase 1
VHEPLSIVTGANQGLGFALTEGLAQAVRPGDVVYLIGRDPDRVSRSAAGLPVVPYTLDVRDGDAVRRFADLVRARHGGVDVVISNAAARLSPQTPWPELIDAFVDTNNLGTTRILRAFASILRPGGRLLVVASSFGTLRNLPRRLHDRFDTDTMSLDDVDATMTQWARRVHAGTAAAEGWPDWINVASKVGQVAAVRVAARERRTVDLESGTLLAAVCPGLVDTAASRPWFGDMSGAQSPAGAARALLDLMRDPVRPETYGELLQFGRILPWR